MDRVATSPDGRGTGRFVPQLLLSSTESVKLKWARAATRHRISRARSRYVIEHCGHVGHEPPPATSPAGASTRFVYLGDDEAGIALEVIAVELVPGRQMVIHAMPLREKYLRRYKEAKKWRM